MKSHMKEPASELQAVLNHLAGPTPSQDMHNIYSDDFLKKYRHITWFNACMYGQTKEGKWLLLYVNTEHRVHVVKAT